MMRLLKYVGRLQLATSRLSMPPGTGQPSTGHVRFWGVITRTTWTRKEVSNDDRPPQLSSGSVLRSASSTDEQCPSSWVCDNYSLNFMSLFSTTVAHKGFSRREGDDGWMDAWKRRNGHGREDAMLRTGFYVFSMLYIMWNGGLEGLAVLLWFDV